VFTSNCTNLTCSFDGTGSNDPEDGNVSSYSWDFNDGSPAGSGAQPQHTYSTGGTYHVTLTVADSKGATNQITHDVTVAAGAHNIGFVGANKYDGVGTSGTVNVPNGTAAGDTLLVFASEASTAQSPATPSGYTQVGTKTSTSNLSSAVYEKTATAADVNGSVTVTFGGSSVKGSVVIADYSNVSNSTPIEAQANATSTNTNTHTAPALSGLTAGTWVVSYFTDKSTTTTAWTTPASETKRIDAYGTSGGAISALVADSGAAVSGNYPAQTATSNAATPSGSAAQWSIALTPSS
jgi:PKD repeat protein